MVDKRLDVVVATPRSSPQIQTVSDGVSCIDHGLRSGYVASHPTWNIYTSTLAPLRSLCCLRGSTRQYSVLVRHAGCNLNSKRLEWRGHGWRHYCTAEVARWIDIYSGKIGSWLQRRFLITSKLPLPMAAWDDVSIGSQRRFLTATHPPGMIALDNTLTGCPRHFLEVAGPNPSWVLGRRRLLASSVASSHSSAPAPHGCWGEDVYWLSMSLPHSRRHLPLTGAWEKKSIRSHSWCASSSAFSSFCIKKRFYGTAQTHSEGITRSPACGDPRMVFQDGYATCSEPHIEEWSKEDAYGVVVVNSSSKCEAYAFGCPLKLGLYIPIMISAI